MLPFDLPAVSRGFAALSPAAAALGRRVAERVAAALAAQLRAPVHLEGRAVPAEPGPGPGLVRRTVSFGALPAPGALELDAALAPRLLDLLAGGSGEAPPALEATPVEEAALDLLLLVALAAAGEEPEVSALAPRLARAGAGPSSPLAVEIAVEAGAARGRCRLLLPAEAVAALAPPAGELAPGIAALEVEAGLANGAADLPAAEIATLEPGDVLLLDEPPGRGAALLLPGLALRGREEEGALRVEEIAVTESSAAFPMVLTVEVARARVTLGDLARVEPGAALPLHAPRDGRVVLRLGDRVVARGRLVEVDGALGVAIESLGDAP
ncbi:MAG TPA: FliM/FliN family flagellar motor switch protein [Anaeromyxobacteraceae bacterium]